MNFLSPGAFFLGLLLPVIIALYLLKLRRVERSVSSNYLWRRMVRDVEANAPWQKLRFNWLMILQLLALAALILALSRPFIWSEGASGQAAIIILDTSASMTAADITPSRIESAKQRASQLINDMPDNARATIIEAGREARVLLSSSLDRRQAHLAIQNVKAGTGGSDMEVALELASAIAARQPGTEIIVLSDGKVQLPKRLVIKGRLRYIPFGLSAENQAISLLTLQSSPGSDSLTAFAQLSNYSQEPASSRLSIYADGLLVNAFDLTDIPPGGQKSAIADGLPAGTKVVSAHIDGKDHFSLDDMASVVRPDTRPALVTLVTQGNRFISTALSLLPGVQLSEQIQEISPAAGSAAPAGNQATPKPSPAPPGVSDPSTASLYIYDGILPENLTAAGSLLFIAPPGSTDFFTTTGLAKNPVLRPVDLDDPLLNHISLAGVNILDAVQIPLPSWASPVAAGDLPGKNIPLIFRGTVDGRRIAVIAFDLRHSDLPLQVAFPLLWANLIEWLAPGAGSTVPVQAAPGESIAFTAPENLPYALITRPDGSTIEVQAVKNRFVISDTTQLGIYAIRFQGNAENGESEKTASFAVNLFSPQESDIRPADSLVGVESETNPSGVPTNRAIREWWRIPALLALGILTSEWMIYQRAALARLRDLLRGIRSKSGRLRL